VLAAVLAAAVLGGVPSAAGQSLYERQDQVNEKIAGLRDQITADRNKEGVLASDIEAASSQIDALEGDIGALSAAIATLEAELAASRARLDRLEALFDEQTRELERLKREYARAQRILETRLVHLYQQGDADSFELLLQVQSFSDFLDQVEYFDSVGRQDRQISTQIESLRDDMRVARERTRVTKVKVAEVTAVLADKTAEQIAARQQLVARQAALAAARSEQRGMLASVRTERGQSEENLAEMQAASVSIAARIRAAQAAAAAAAAAAEAEAQAQAQAQQEAQQEAPQESAPPASSGGGASSSGFVWPVSGVVTSGFGPRWGGMHEGLDIAAPCGTPLRAAAAGTIIFAGWMGGYGNLTIIDHGNGLATAYGHQSAIYAGGTVSQGQTIGAVGTTGHSTGCHLHFEVRVNGSPVDPLGYL